MDVTQLVEAYGQSWNEAEEADRRKLLEDAWGDDATYCDPTAMVTGPIPRKPKATKPNAKTAGASIR